MPLLLPNVYLNTARTSYNPTTAQTSGATPNLSQIPAHISASSSKQLSVLPEAAFGSDYMAIVESGTRIAIGDVISSITLLDGITPWPGDVIPAGNANAPVMIWKVKYIQEASAGFLPYRKVFLVRAQLSGPAGN